MWTICSIAFKNIFAIDKLKKDFSFQLEMEDLGEAKKVLGMEIERQRKDGKVSLTQKGHLKKILQKFNINGDMKSVCIPSAPHFKLEDTMSPTSIEEREYMTRVPYASVVNSLIYAMVCTRTDLSQAISMVSGYIHDTDRGHWEAVK